MSVDVHQKTEEAMYRLTLAIAVVCMVLFDHAYGQEHHAQGHADYQNWASPKTSFCCNNQDCGALPDSQTRNVETGTQVLIAGQWCPVLMEHRVVKGKSPDWQHRHACIRAAQDVDNGDPCQRLLCFMEGGGT